MPSIDVRAARQDECGSWYPLWRGLGLGRRLIEHVYAQAKARGCARVHWLTHETSLDAMKLCDGIADKRGFMQYRKAL